MQIDFSNIEIRSGSGSQASWQPFVPPARLLVWKDEAMKNAAMPLMIATALLTSPPVQARDRLSAGIVVSSTTASLIASAQAYCTEYCRGPYLATAPAIFGYGYRATYYGNGFVYQPARAVYFGPGFRGCCRW